MRIRVGHLYVAALLLMPAAGCTRKALQNLDGGIGTLPVDANGGDGRVGDTTGVTDVRGASDLPIDVAFPGRSFVVMSRLMADGGAANGIMHTFTMTLDTDRRVAIVGVPGGGNIQPVEQTADGPLRFMHPLTFWASVPVACGATVRYDDLTFTIEPTGRLSGRGRGQLTALPATSVVGITMELTGLPDTESPTLSLTAAGSVTDPWTALWVVASEPLPANQMWPVLRSAGGDVVTFQIPTGMEEFVATLAKPSRMLRFGEPYHVTFDGITDYAGNPPKAGAEIAFTTRALPPLTAADGFESVTDATLGGAQVLSGDGAPTISGARSLYVPAATSLGTGGAVTQFALRVPVPPGATLLRFAYRTVDSGDEGSVQYFVGSVGGTIATTSFGPGIGASTPAMIGQIPVTLGPMVTAIIGLPEDARDEVVVARVASQLVPCFGPAPLPVSGIIIDDLRAE